MRRKQHWGEENNIGGRSCKKLSFPFDRVFFTLLNPTRQRTPDLDSVCLTGIRTHLRCPIPRGSLQGPQWQGDSISHCSLKTVRSSISVQTAASWLCWTDPTKLGLPHGRGPVWLVSFQNKHRISVRGALIDAKLGANNSYLQPPLPLLPAATKLALPATTAHMGVAALTAVARSLLLLLLLLPAATLLALPAATAHMGVAALTAVARLSFLHPFFPYQGWQISPKQKRKIKPHCISVHRGPTAPGTP
jgi:hypothetical protein